MLVKQHIPIHITASNGVLSKGQKTFNTQIQQIEKLRHLLAAWDVATTAYHEKYTRELTPLVTDTMALQTTLLFKLDSVSGEKGFNKSERKMLGEVITELAEQLLIENDDAEIKSIFNKHSQTDYDSLESASLQGMKSMLEDILGFEPGELDNLDSPEEILRRAHVQIEENQARHQSERQELEARRSKSKKKSARQLEKEAQAEADAKKINQSIRDVYRKLASALHPDRETDPQERERKTLLMQRINQAYEKQNLLLLLELQLELEHIDQIAIARIDEDRLRHYNTILKGQIAELKHELMRVESSFCGQFGMAPFARVKPETVLRDLSYEILQAQQANNELERELHTLKDAKSVKAWLKKIRRGVANNSFDDCPF
jgi:hypothetical protein